MKFSVKDFFGKYEQICSFLQIWSDLLIKFSSEKLIFCAVTMTTLYLNNFFETWKNIYHKAFKHN